MKKIILLVILNFFCLNIYFSQSNTPCGAPLLTVNTLNCSYVTGTTVGATYQNDAANGGTPSCGFPGTPDVWYSFIVPASGAVSVATTAGTITDGAMAVYHGPCNNLQFIDCSDDAGASFMPIIDRTDFIPGDTIHIRFWNAGSSSTGTFHICLVQAHSDCHAASFICNQMEVFPQNALGNGTITELMGQSNICGSPEFQSHWLKFKIGNSGTLVFMIYPDSTATGFYPDYDWVLFQDNNPNFCTNYDTVNPPNPVACNASSSMGANGITGIDPSGTSYFTPPGPGNPMCPSINVNAGEIYYMVLNNANATQSGFQIHFTGTATLDCNQSVDVENTDNAGFSENYIEPNPASDLITINTGIMLREAMTLNIYTVLGQLAGSETIWHNKQQINVSYLTNGVYITELVSKNKRQNNKLIIRK